MRSVFVAALTAAALVGVPGVAHATIDACPAGVSDVSGGVNPSLAQVSAWIEASAAAHDVPASVLKVIAYKESTWRQYAADGTPLVSSDTHCGLGIMQVNAETRDDAVRLANDPAYNVDEGAKILADKYAGAQGTPPGDTGEPDDTDVIENWYYAICLYNGCPSGPGQTDYADAAAGILSDPFRRLPLSFRAFMPPAGFSRPQDADSTYTLTTAFQARHDPDVFVYYNASTGVVQKYVEYPTHLVSAPPVVAYPALTYGPDTPQVTCAQCSGWRLAEGAGISGRAHWTNTVSGPTQASVTWSMPLSQGPGRYRVEAYVPPVDVAPMGQATYAVAGDYRTIDQEARRSQWVGIAETTFSATVPVVLGDSSSVANQRIAADAMRLLPVPTVRLRTDLATIGYGGKTTLRVDLTDVGGQALGGRSVTIYARPVGTTAWKGLGLWKTNSTGSLAVGAAPSRNTEYTARFVPAVTDPHARAASNNVRVNVSHRVGASVPSTSMSSGGYGTVNVSVGPNHAGRTVYLQRLYGSTWKTVLSRTLSSSSTASFRFTFTVDRTQVVQFRGYMPTDSEHLGGYSTPVGITVQR